MLLYTLGYLALDVLFVYALIAFGDEMGGYIILCLLLIALMTYAVIHTFKKWLKS